MSMRWNLNDLVYFHIPRRRERLRQSWRIRCPDEVKEERRDRVMELQQEISLDHGQDMIGRELEVFIEGQVADENAYVGRTYMDAPGVDGYIFVNTGLELMSGDVRPCPGDRSSGI